MTGFFVYFQFAKVLGKKSNIYLALLKHEYSNPVLKILKDGRKIYIAEKK